MILKLLPPLLLLLLWTCPLAAREPLKPDHQKQFVGTIRSQGYPCDHYSDGYFLEETTKGLLFRVECEDGERVYRVIVTPYNKIIVKPWSDDSP